MIPAIKTHSWLADLDRSFMHYLQEHDATLVPVLKAYRSDSKEWTPAQMSAFILRLAPYLEQFLGAQFKIEQALVELGAEQSSHRPIFEFKRTFVHQARKRPQTHLHAIESFESLQAQVMQMLSTAQAMDDVELAYAQCAFSAMQSKDQARIACWSDWCLHALHTEAAQRFVQGWVSFQRPDKIDSAHLVERVPLGDVTPQVTQGPTLRHREGFDLTDPGMSAREINAQVDYCIFCHKNQGDFCRKGFPVKKADPEQGLKRDVFDTVLTGCPLDEKISEMQWLFSKGHLLAALAVIMIDNPLCPMTGHRICNDCMKSCVYQKQTPVNVPQIETFVLKSILNVPWGVEVYDLLLNWNPLRAEHYMLAPDQEGRVLVMGMGPAGLTLANQLLMRGYAVVGMDGLKIEPIDPNSYTRPVESFSAMTTALDARKILGFGGVAEYGITARWDKNFLSLILLTLLRRARFRVLGGVRFGGTLRIEDAWDLGFDHLALAVGAGLPRALSLPGSEAPGVRQANDFLMALQLSGAYHEMSLSGLEVQLPAVVIGGGLTGIDTATEVQAYYILQIQRAYKRYHALCDRWGAAYVRDQFNAVQLGRLDEWIMHAQTYMRAKDQPGFKVADLVRAWGGVTVVYRKRLQDSPAYQRNHEEVIKALEEGILYAECFAPAAIIQDEHGQCRALNVNQMMRDASGDWYASESTATFPAKSVLVATGAQPNVAYAFEHDGVLDRKRYQYVPYHLNESGALVPAPDVMHCKSDAIGFFTSYQRQGRTITFLGDTHATFHGSVVKAMASAMQVTPVIDAQVSALDCSNRRMKDQTAFLKHCESMMSARVSSVKALTQDRTQLIIHAPQVALRFLPGHFVRLQTFESYAVALNALPLHSEGVALPVLSVDQAAGTVSVVVSQRTVSERILSKLTPDQPVSLMGPTGVRAKIPDQPQTILLCVTADLMVQACVLGKALREAGHLVLMAVSAPCARSIYLKSELYEASDYRLWHFDAEDSFMALGSNDVKAQGVFWPEILDWLSTFDRDSILSTLTDVRVLGPADLIETVRSELSCISDLTQVAVTRCEAAVYGPMQCMLKGVCAQCLQWQIDPLTGEKTKAVYACSWQQQPIDRIDVTHLSYRQAQQGVLEVLNGQWLSLHEKNEIHL